MDFTYMHGASDNVILYSKFCIATGQPVIRLTFDVEDFLPRSNTDSANFESSLKNLFFLKSGRKQTEYVLSLL